MKTHRNCCGLDVHKQTIAACLIREDGMGNTCKEKRLFGTMTRDLCELAQWLRGAEVSAVAMEATGESSEIRTGCANERSSGSVEGVLSNHDPYSDQASGASWP